MEKHFILWKPDENFQFYESIHKLHSIHKDGTYLWYNMKKIPIVTFMLAEIRILCHARIKSFSLFFIFANNKKRKFVGK